MNIAAELRNAVMDNFTIDKRLVSDAADAIEMLGEENAKLRELVQDMWFWSYEGHIDSESQEQQMEHIGGVLDRMRELGIDNGVGRSNNGVTRWARLFGTPERAARTLEEFELDQLNWCHGTEYCESCPYEFDRYGCCLPDGFSLYEWLGGDA